MELIKYFFASLAYANWLAILVSALAAFALGGLWYSPVLFAKPWMKETGVDPEKQKTRSVALAFGGTFVLQLMAAAVLSVIVRPMNDAVYGAITGLGIGVFFVGTAMGTNYLYEGKSLKLFLINLGYAAALLTIMGAILAAWH